MTKKTHNFLLIICLSSGPSGSDSVPLRYSCEVWGVIARYRVVIVMRFVVLQGYFPHILSICLMGFGPNPAARNM